MNKAESRVAIVTGAAQGIGLAIAERLAQQGHHIAVLDIHAEKAAQAAAQLRETYPIDALGIGCDISNLAQIKAATGKVHAHFSRIDVLINNAGILHSAPIAEVSESEWDAVLNINLKGSFFMTQSALPFLESSPAGRVIFIASVAGRMGSYESGVAYVASKGGMLSMMRCMARQLAPSGITVNAVCPGTIESEMTQHFQPGALERLLGRIPAARLGTPDDIAAATAFLAAEDAGYINGISLDVNGGMYMA